MRLRHLSWGHPGKTSARKGHTGLDAAGAERPNHVPPLAARDEATYLLNIGAEIEHALMVQYLYAAYSLEPKRFSGERAEIVSRWRQTILEIAREEMGHLATVQNLLRLIGEPLTLDRSEFPFATSLYPFEFRLEPLSVGSLAKYVVAEMPPGLNDPEIRRIRRLAKAGNVGMPVNRVGSLYAQVGRLFEKISDEDLGKDSLGFQARGSEWGLGYKHILILNAGNRAEARAAIDAIAEQGEGVLTAPKSCNDMPADSHFARFLKIFREFPKGGQWRPAVQTPIHPNLCEPGATNNWSKNMEAGRITHEETRLWAQLSNRRYRMLLMFLSHALHLETPLDAGDKPTTRGLLLTWTFGEMYNLRSLAGFLIHMKLKEGQRDSDRRVAGLPFELPFSLQLPEREIDRWRLNRDLLQASMSLTAEIAKISAGLDGAGVFLRSMREADQAALAIALSLIDQNSPVSAVRSAKSKVARGVTQSRAAWTAEALAHRPAPNAPPTTRAARVLRNARYLERAGRRASSGRDPE